jgi:tetratricopeptide (TPR) repeat protein
VLDNLGTNRLHLGDPATASGYFARALRIFREIGDREGEAWALNGLGEAASTAGRPADALGHHTAALALATDLGVTIQQARAHAGLGRAHLALADPGQARHHYERALAIYTELEAPEADQLRGRLATCSTPLPVTGRRRADPVPPPVQVLGHQ